MAWPANDVALERAKDLVGHGACVKNSQGAEISTVTDVSTSRLNT